MHDEIKELSDVLKTQLSYIYHHRHRCGLYFWQNDYAIDVDNDPCTYFRPPRSSGSIFLNCLMYKELEAMVYLSCYLDLQDNPFILKRSGTLHEFYELESGEPIMNKDFQL